MPKVNEQRIIKSRGSFIALFPWVFLYWPWWRRHTLEITDQRVILRSGWFSKDERTVALDRVQDVRVKQGLFGRMFGYGDIYIETAGSTATEFVFKRLGKVAGIRDAIYAARDQYQERRTQEEEERMARMMAAAQARS